MNKNALERIVVTGLGVIAPNGTSIERFWANCCAGRSGVARIGDFDVSRYSSQVAGIVTDFDPAKWGIDAEHCATLDRHALFALAASADAVDQAGLASPTIDRDRLGVCIATAIAGTKFMEEEFLRRTEGAREAFDETRVDPLVTTNTCFHLAATEVARRWGARGPVHALATGCTGGLDALGHAAELIRSGAADVVIAGAAEAPLTPIALAAFDVIGAIVSDRNEDPTRASRPYDKHRAGFVLGEGCGILVLERLAHAEARGAPVLAELSGFGSTCNAYHMTDLAPDGNDLHRAMKIAMADAHARAEAIDHVNAHGSSTQQNDVNETNAVKQTLGAHAYTIPICSLKSIVGHALAAANAIEAVAAVLSILHQTTPPTINLETPDPDCDLDYVRDGARTVVIDHVLKDASGFSGIHSAVVLSRHCHPETGARQ
jgi:3-oxoacyl-(acyl-carrier-protein) synthase